MAHVISLTRYPVKGFTAEPLEALTVQPDGRIEGDRVLAFRFARAAEPEEREGLEHWPKAKGLALQDFPALAALRLSYDHAARRVRITHDGAELIEAGLDEAGRVQMAEAVTDYVLSTPEGARLRGPGRLPLVMVGDGTTSRFQDRARGFVSVHGQASVDALAAEFGSAVDGRRFRSNVVIDGFPAWQELEWTGEVRIGEVAFSAEGPIVRCLATHANPDTGDRDAPVLTTLTRGIGQKQPTLGRLLLPSDRGGVIRVGDEVRVG
ncbi:MOSC domain-containing protein [Leucobacter coleopterorum]|uniref:MOSC domain-containing protein n=1 Tax=Leucobacter coleopterorum TaxID=2714933 RepID=A0ABX6JUR1_9MICO|nr:MOSC domain-containing protein [Leucobacter coleopterorum]QIM18039.1 MOSC domain-containing protein [Leucobacter coleopterorum]